MGDTMISKKMIAVLLCTLIAFGSFVQAQNTPADCADCKKPYVPASQEEYDLSVQARERHSRKAADSSREVRLAQTESKRRVEAFPLRERISAARTQYRQLCRKNPQECLDAFKKAMEPITHDISKTIMEAEAVGFDETETAAWHQFYADEHEKGESIYRAKNPVLFQPPAPIEPSKVVEPQRNGLKGRLACFLARCFPQNLQPAATEYAVNKPLVITALGGTIATFAALRYGKRQLCNRFFKRTTVLPRPLFGWFKQSTDKTSKTYTSSGIR
jgi:hypothetical protein